MISDLAIFPIVIVTAIGLKALLMGFGLDHSAVFLSCFFLVLHFLLGLLMKAQFRGEKDSYVTKSEMALYGALFSSFVALVTYITLSLVPILKVPFAFLKYVPTGAYWSELFVVALPTFITHVGARWVGKGLLAP